MKQAFINRKFNASSVKVIEQANVIIADYLAAGFKLTLRQLYYQFVARGLMPNKQQNYKRLGSIISDARLAGLIDWDTIEDRTRAITRLSTWDSPADIIDSCVRSFRLDLWQGQDVRPEVWIEKEALAGVIEPICNELRVAYFACRGYASQSAQYESSLRFHSHRLRDKQRVVVFHLGDHDPSGIDMTRENEAKIALLAGRRIQFVRLALNMDQVEELSPPPNPAKETDSRFEGYRALYGDESWELDALDPTYITNLIREAIEPLRDPDKWDAMMQLEKEQRSQLRLIKDNWDDVVEFVEGFKSNDDDTDEEE